MDIEGFARARMNSNSQNLAINLNDLTNILSKRILEYKDMSDESSIIMAEAVIDEVKNTLKINEYQNPNDNNDGNLLKEIVAYPKANIGMGEMGIGSRGSGDFFVHRKIAEIVSSTQTDSFVDPTAQDDGGVVKVNTCNTTSSDRQNNNNKNNSGEDLYITTAVDGIHSRLSEYPFLGGFHVARASLRDVCVMGADPVAIISDIHLADDGDIGKLFDFTAGVATVSELIDVPIVAGSTLRVGGDMVLGDRLVSAVGSIGVSKYPPTARKRAESEDVILLTEGSGGGTITTTALYHGLFDIVWETMDINFIKAANALINDNLVKYIHAMTDVTNGGLRGDAHEIASTTGLGLDFDHESIREMVTPKVLNMLESLNIDPLGVSIDSLMLITDENTAKKVKKSVARAGVKISEIGTVNNSGVPKLFKSNGEIEELTPLFREAAYTKIKKLVGNTTPEEFELMKEKVQKAADEAITKKDKVVDFISNN